MVANYSTAIMHDLFLRGPTCIYIAASREDGYVSQDLFS